MLDHFGAMLGTKGRRKNYIHSSWRENVGVGVSHVWPMLGHVEALLGWYAWLRPFGGASWGHVEAMLGMHWVIWGFTGDKN